MISPHRIKYRGIESTELNMLDLIMCVAFESDNGEMSTYLNREAIVSETHDGRYKRVHSYKYNESFSPKFTFMKKGFGDFTTEEVRRILKWLTSTDKTALLDVYYDDSNVVGWSVIGGWTEISTYKMANNRTVGIIATFESITPYAFSDLYTITKTINSATNKIVIEIDTDEPNQPVYPRITIKQKGAAGDVKITNQHYDIFNQPSTPVVTMVKNNTATETIIVDGANQIISSSSAGRPIFGDDFNWEWLPLYDGRNELTIEGNCDIEIAYREVRKVGEY